jgi:hypothetical protein
MYESGRKLLIFVTICFLFIFTGSSYVFAKGGEYTGGGERQSGPVIERGNNGVSRQVIEDDAIRNGYYRGEDIPYDDNPQDGIIVNENNDPNNDDNNSDDDDSDQ